MIKYSLAVSVSLLNAILATRIFQLSETSLANASLLISAVLLLPIVLTGLFNLLRRSSNFANKLYLYSASAACISLGLATVIYADQLLPAKTIAGTFGQVQVQAPATWKISQHQSAEEAIHIRDRMQSQSVLVVPVTQSKPFYTLQDIAELALMQLGEQTTVDDKKGPVACALGALSCIQYRVQMRAEGENLTMLYTLVKGKRNSYHIMATTSSAQFDVKKQQIEAIVRSFKEVPT